MGWGSGGEILEPLLDLMADSDPPVKVGDKSYRIVVKMIRTLQGQDWDTETETLEDWRHVPWIVEAFRECGVTLECLGSCDHCGHACQVNR